MGKINLTLNDDLERQFRELAYKTKGMKKGFLTDATEEAITIWLEYVKLQMSKSRPSDDLWPVEQKALDDIKSGKTKMITQSGQEFLDDLQSIIDEKA
jgi:hypothetical protein